MTTKPSLELYFGNTDTPGLYRTVFYAPGHDYPVVPVVINVEPAPDDF
jgi:hypothetical protein